MHFYSGGDGQDLALGGKALGRRGYNELAVTRKWVLAVKRPSIRCECTL